MTWHIQRLGAADAGLMAAANALFAEAFDGDANYTSAPPSEGYLAETLALPSVIALVAQDGAKVVGALVAYVLPKLEQARSEVYIYDLAVATPARRQGVATGLIKEVQAIAADVGAWVVYVQADYEDPPAVALYTQLGVREEVLHFDLPVDGKP